jgi:hypothetical protein
MIESHLLGNLTALEQFVEELRHIIPTYNKKISITLNLPLMKNENNKNVSSFDNQKMEFSFFTPNHENAPFGFVLISLQ